MADKVVDGEQADPKNVQDLTLFVCESLLFTLSYVDALTASK